VSRWVIDSSLALAWGLPDERSPSADRFWSHVESGSQLWVPSLWWYEIANALVVVCRRGRLDATNSREILRLLGRLPVTTASPPVGDELRRLHALAVKHDLSAYDAAYLDLARTLSVDLGTLDQRLTAAARDEGLTVWDGG
jgi:predicted nucleic acid-binding protein